MYLLAPARTDALDYPRPLKPQNRGLTKFAAAHMLC